MSWQTFLINNLVNLALHDGGNLVAIFFVYSMMRATFGKLCPLLIFGQRGHLLISCAPLGHSFNFAWLPKHSVVAAGVAENSRGLKYKLGCDIFAVIICFCYVLMISLDHKKVRFSHFFQMCCIVPNQFLIISLDFRHFVLMKTWDFLTF